MRPFRVADLPLQLKLPLLVGTLLLGFGTAIYSVAYFRVRREYARATAERLAGVTGQIATLLATQGRALASAAVARADTAPVRAFLATERGPATAAFAALRAGRTGDSLLAGIVLRDAQGRVLATDGPRGAALAAQLAPDELPHATLDTGVVGRFRTLADSVYFPTTALVTDGGTPLGYVTTWNRMARAPSARGPIAQLIGSDALMLIGSRGGAWMTEAGPGPAPVLNTPPAADGLYRYDRGGVPVLASLVDVAGTPWSVAVEFPKSVVTTPAHRFLIATAPIGALLIAVGLVLAWLASRRFTRPLGALTDATTSVGHADAPIQLAFTGGDEIGRLAAAFNRMAKRIEEEATARQASEIQWRAVFTGSPIPKLVSDAESGRILAVNPAACREYGYSEEEFLRLRLADVEAVPVDDPAADGTPQARHRTKPGEVIDVEITSHQLAFAGRPATLTLAQNVTGRNMLEARFRHAQKMQAIGRLAGGVAHDFNNFLTVIGAYAELALDGLPEDDPRAKDLQEILRAANQANRLTRQLLAFTRQQVIQPEVLELDTAVFAMGEMLRHLLREDAELVTRLGSAHAKVKIDPGHLEQVVMNLVVNARDALSRGGRITIGTTATTLDPESARLHGVDRPGRYAVLSVADTGVGMSAETRARIFEPFFTTKTVGKGTGLGLATVYGVVTQAGGQITVYSEPGVGSTFRVYLPMADQKATPEEPAPPSAIGLLTGHETILLVEDEASVRAAAHEVLTRQGYTVLAAGDPHEAMAIAAQHGKAIDLIVSDVVMPHSDGPTLVRRLRQEYPRLRALLMSGYAGESLPTLDSSEGELPFIAKPFTVGALARKIREVLDG